MKTGLTTCAQCAALFFAGAALLASSLSAQNMRPADEWNYTVAKGDTLIGLIERLMKPSTNWQQLQKLNKLANDKRLAPGSVLRIPVAWLRADTAVATVTLAQGGVTVRRGMAQLPAPAAGAELLPGDRIETAAQSTLAVRLADGSKVVVAPLSKVVLETLLVYGKTGITETRLKIEDGSVDSKVTPVTSSASKYLVTTPVFNLGVRGTDFRARYDASTQVAFNEVLEGKVATQGKASEVLIGGGFGTLALINTEPKPAIKLLDAPKLTGVQARIEQVPLNLKWEAEAAAKAYRAKVFQNQALERQLLEGVFTTPTASWLDLPDGSYVLQVRSIDKDGLEGNSAMRDFVLKARPVAPFSNQPVNTSKVYGDDATFKWSASLAAEKYRLQVADSADFKTPLVDRPDVVGTELKLPLPPGNYFWRVAAVAAGNDQGPFGVGSTFTQRKIPQSPSSLEPPLVGENEMLFSWKASEPGQTFKYQVSSDPTFATVQVDQTTAEPRARFPKPSPGTFYLRIKTIDSEGFEGPFGAPQKFTIEEPAAPWWKPAPLLLLLLLL
jgi:hypothetical protein